MFNIATYYSSVYIRVEARVRYEQGDQCIDEVPDHKEKFAISRAKRPAEWVEQALLVVSDLHKMQE